MEAVKPSEEITSGNLESNFWTHRGAERKEVRWNGLRSIMDNDRLRTFGGLTWCPLMSTRRLKWLEKNQHPAKEQRPEPAKNSKNKTWNEFQRRNVEG